MKKIPLLRGGHTIVDDEDCEFLSRWNWRMNDCGYAIRSIYLDGKSTSVRMSRAIMKPPADLVVDHINGDKLDNRRCNLRICTPMDNARNGGKRSTNTSGLKGAYQCRFKHTDWCKWYTLIRINGKYVRIGSFETREEAAGAYITAALEYHGEFANLD